MTRINTIKDLKDLIKDMDDDDQVRGYAYGGKHHGEDFNLYGYTYSGILFIDLIMGI